MRLPNALPDETLYSRLCRHLTLSGLVTQQYLSRVFGNARIPVHPFLNAHLEKISRFSDESAHELWLEQTLAPLFSFYLPQYGKAIQNIQATPGELFRVCQLPSFREREPLSVKYCPQCVIEDLTKFGVTYWHCVHQVIGVEACHEHGIWLIHVDLPTRYRIAPFFFPYLNSDIPPEKSPQLATEFSHYVHRKLQAIRAQRAKLPNYHSRLAEKGFITKHGRIRRKALYGELFDLLKQVLPLESALLPRSKDDYKYWSSLFVEEPCQPPFKHLLMSFGLEGVIGVKVPAPVKSYSVSNTLENVMCRDLLQKELSIAEVSRRIGRSRCYVKSIALSEGITSALKPKTITDRVILAIVKMARKGFHRKAIADRFSLSTGSVELIISTTNGLVEWRKHCKFESSRRRHKVKILRFMTERPQCSRQDVKLSCSAAFFWLYRHQKEWLQEILPPPRKPQHVDRVNWEVRDRMFAPLVADLLNREQRVMSLAELDRKLGNHGWLIAKKRKLPLTLAVIKKHNSLFN